MKRNAVAWVALIVSTAALVSSRGVTRPLPAAPKVTAESQKTAHALSEAFNAVAEFVKPSVVQITVEKKAGVARPGVAARTRSARTRRISPTVRKTLTPKSLRRCSNASSVLVCDLSASNSGVVWKASGRGSSTTTAAIS